MKRFFELCLLIILAASSSHAAQGIFGGRLDTPLNGNGKTITNLGSISSSNYLDAATGLPITLGGGSSLFTSGQSTTPRVVGGSNTFDVTGTLTNNTTGSAAKAAITSSQAQAVLGVDGSQNFTVTGLGPAMVGAQPAAPALSNIVNLASNRYIGSFVGSLLGGTNFVGTNIVAGTINSNRLDAPTLALLGTAQTLARNGSTTNLYLWASAFAVSGPASISINTSNRTLADSLGNPSVQWDARFMYGLSGTPALDWVNRLLYSSSSEATIDWENKVFSPGWTFTGVSDPRFTSSDETITSASNVFNANMVVSGTNYTDRVEATNSGTLTIAGGGAQATLSSSSLNVSAAGGVNLSGGGSFNGVGSGLTALDGSAVSSGTVAEPRVAGQISRTNQLPVTVAGTNGITVITTPGLPATNTIHFNGVIDYALISVLEVLNLYGTNFFTLKTNAPALGTDANSKLVTVYNLVGTNDSRAMNLSGANIITNASNILGGNGAALTGIVGFANTNQFTTNVPGSAVVGPVRFGSNIVAELDGITSTNLWPAIVSSNSTPAITNLQQYAALGMSSKGMRTGNGTSTNVDALWVLVPVQGTSADPTFQVQLWGRVGTNAYVATGIALNSGAGGSLGITGAIQTPSLIDCGNYRGPGGGSGNFTIGHVSEQNITVQSSNVWFTGNAGVTNIGASFTVAGALSAKTNTANLAFVDNFISALATRYTNGNNRATLMLGIGNVDVATGTPQATVKIEQNGPGGAMTNIYIFTHPGGIVSSFTNWDNCGLLNPNAVVTVTDTSGGSGASVSIAGSVLQIQ